MARKRKLKRRVRNALEGIADAIALSNSTATLIAAHVRRSHARIDWTIDGREDLAAELAKGQPVIMALWHGRLSMAPTAWDPDWGPLCVVTSAARPGRMVGNVMTRFGHGTLPINDRSTDTSSVLQVARMARDGTSIGFAVDGPHGPPRIAKTVPIDWARLTGTPIWLFTFSTERYGRLGIWDQSLLPKRGKGCMVYRRWEEKVPKKLDANTREALRLKLQQDLDALTLQADRMMGHEGLIN